MPKSRADELHGRALHEPHPRSTSAAPTLSDQRGLRSRIDSQAMVKMRWAGGLGHPAAAAERLGELLAHHRLDRVGLRLVCTRARPSEFRVLFGSSPGRSS